MTIKVQATKKGFYAGRVIQSGEIFEVNSKEEIGSWMSTMADEIKAPKAAKAPKAEKAAEGAKATEQGDKPKQEAGADLA